MDRRQSTLREIAASTGDRRRSLSRRSMLGLVAATTISGCVGRVLNPPEVALTGIRLHNLTEYRTPVRVELFRESERVLDERVSIAGARFTRTAPESESVALFAPEWSVEPARYRIRVDVPDGDATLERLFPPDDYRWAGCAYVDVGLENGWEPYYSPGPDAEKWFHLHLKEVSDSDQFSSEYCPD